MMCRDERMVSFSQDLNSSRRRSSVELLLIGTSASRRRAVTMRAATASLCSTSMYVLLGASIGAAWLTGKSRTSLPWP